MPRYQRHYLETENDFDVRRYAKSRKQLAVLYYILAAFLIFSLGMFVYTFEQAINYHP